MASRRNQNRDNGEMKKITDEIKSCKMLKDIGIKKFVDVDDGYAYVVAKNSEDLKTNQLRKFFAAIRKIEQKNSWDEIESEFYLIKPRMAVAAGRKKVPKPFYKLIMVCMEKVDVGSEEEKMKNLKLFTEFFESLVAYHKYLYGEKR